VTTLVIDRFDLPATRRAERRLDSTCRRTLDELAGRTVWSFSALSAGRESAGRLTERLRWTGVPVAEAAEGLDGVAADDLVFLHDSGTAWLAQAARQRGAHVVRRVGTEHAWEPARPHASAVDAYVMAWARRIAALLPAPGLVALKEMEPSPYEDLCWSSLLADVVRSDRDEHVGGRLHARPTVAAR
jgi:hypothetical protein